MAMRQDSAPNKRLQNNNIPAGNFSPGQVGAGQLPYPYYAPKSPPGSPSSGAADAYHVSVIPAFASYRPVSESTPAGVPGSVFGFGCPAAPFGHGCGPLGGPKALPCRCKQCPWGSLSDEARARFAPYLPVYSCNAIQVPGHETVTVPPMWKIEPEPWEGPLPTSLAMISVPPAQHIGPWPPAPGVDLAPTPGMLRSPVPGCVPTAFPPPLWAPSVWSPEQSDEDKSNGGSPAPMVDGMGMGPPNSPELPPPVGPVGVKHVKQEPLSPGGAVAPVAVERAPERKFIKKSKSGGFLDCPYCEMRVASNLGRHIRRRHPGSPVVYRCQTCGEMFSDRQKMLQHFREVHLIACPLCKRRIHPKKFADHQKAHLCPTCGKQFEDFSNLNRHRICVHNYQKPKTKPRAKLRAKPRAQPGAVTG